MKPAAQILGISEDTLRRWAETGRAEVVADETGRLSVTGDELARLSREQAPEDAVIGQPIREQSTRNRFTGIVTELKRDLVMAQVEVQAGPHRIVSLISREACDDLALEVGSLVVAAVKATNVSVEVPTSR